jgi:hypothetical protein
VGQGCRDAGPGERGTENAGAPAGEGIPMAMLASGSGVVVTRAWFRVGKTR